MNIFLVHVAMMPTNSFLCYLLHCSPAGQSRRPSESQTNKETDGGESPSERPQLTHEVSSSPSVAQSEAEEPAAVPVQTRIRDLSSFFKMGPGGFSRNPEAFAFVQLRNYLSNIKWVSIYEIFKGTIRWVRIILNH